MNENLTLKDLAVIITKLLENKKNETLPVMLVENVVSKGEIKPTIRHMNTDDIKLEKNLQLTGNFVYSQCDEGIVIGFITIVE